MQPSLDDILQFDKLDLPPYPKVDEIEWYPFTESLGDSAFRITVILADDTPPEHRERKLTREIENRIRETLQKAGIEEFSYIRNATRADLKWAEEHR